MELAHGCETQCLLLIEYELWYKYYLNQIPKVIGSPTCQLIGFRGAYGKNKTICLFETSLLIISLKSLNIEFNILKLFE